MGPLNIEQVYGLALSGVTFLLCAAVAEVEAAPLFPPAHVSAQFVEAGEIPATAVNVQPWYFQGQARAESVLTLSRAAALGGTQVAATVDITPWYRAAN